MIYSILVIIIIASLVTLSILSYKQKHPTALLWINTSLFLTGVTLFVLSYTIGTSQINALVEDTALQSWAKDYFDLYYDLSVIPFIVLFVINTIAVVLRVFDSRHRKALSQILSRAVSILSSLLLLLIPYYGYFTQNDEIPLILFIMLSGIGQALVIRAADAIGLIYPVYIIRGTKNEKK